MFLTRCQISKEIIPNADLNLKANIEGDSKSEMKRIKQHLRRDAALANGNVLFLSAESIFVIVY